MLNLIVYNYFDGKLAKLELVSSKKTFGKDEYRNIVEIFNQPECSKSLFSSDKDKAFSVENAKSFIKFYKDGESQKSKYLYILKEGKQIIGGVDLQVVDKKTATLGFWQDNKKSGYMTNAVSALIKIAKEKGFEDLDAYVELDNKKAMNLLLRTGFEKKEIVKGRTKTLRKFVLAS